jgi:hypothetical protein
VVDRRDYASGYWFNPGVARRKNDGIKSMTLTFPFWAIPVGLIIAVWLFVFIFPMTRSNHSGMDFGMAGIVEGFVSLVVGLFLTVVILIGWLIFK